MRISKGAGVCRGISELPNIVGKADCCLRSLKVFTFNIPSPQKAWCGTKATLLFSRCAMVDAGKTQSSNHLVPGDQYISRWRPSNHLRQGGALVLLGAEGPPGEAEKGLHDVSDVGRGLRGEVVEEPGGHHVEVVTKHCLEGFPAAQEGVDTGHGLEVESVHLGKVLQ